jgi:DNA-binding NtrC family response regulator
MLEPVEKRTILVIDDNVDILETTAQLIQTLGYQVIVASDAKAGLTALQEHPGVSVIFTDVVMPGALRSIELAELARELNPLVKVIFMTGYGDTSKMLLGETAVVIEKPFSLEQLENVITSSLGVESSQ